ncbi:Ift172, partial [Symbiodinium microadriaticum]
LLKGNAAQLSEAVELLGSKGGPCTEDSIIFYHRVVSAVLSRTLVHEQSVDHGETVSTLREVLFKVAKGFRSSSADKRLPLDMEELLMATHYQHMYNLCIENGLIDVAAKCSITLLKYPDIVNADKAFYQAGITCRDQGNTNLAFLLLNRYVDLTEAIDTNDASFMDNTDFQEADAIPLNGPLPDTHYLEDEDMRE